MKNKYLVNFVLCNLLLIGTISGQQKAVDLDSLNQKVSKLSKSVQFLENIKISGYIQAQYQLADTLGVKSFEGGDFAKASSQRFMVRRGYFKVAFTGSAASYTIQININEKGFSVRDAYFTLKEPWLKTFSLNGGIFMRPFGNELLYPTNQREAPELSRMTQTLFPGERDLGASVVFQRPVSSWWHPLRIEAGLFNGNGISSETDDKLDFIGKIGWASETLNKKVAYSAGFSYYNGSVYQAKKQVYKMQSSADTVEFEQVKSDTIPGRYQDRIYYGLDGQLVLKSVLGTTTIRADYIWGNQPASDSSSMSPSDKAVGAPLYLRNFNGYVVYLIQSIGNSGHSVFLKLDSYDPNTKVKGDKIGGVHTALGKTTGIADIAYTTWGLGYQFDVNKNLRLTLYYAMVKNETSKFLGKYSSDLKDNVLTARIQYKF